jgi:RNA polymerase sigma factor (sigma-70 family)
MIIKAISRADQDLLEGVQKADRNMLNLLYKAYLPDLVFYVQQNNGTGEEAKDVYQDAVLVLYKKIQEGLQLQVPLKHYFMAICRNLWRMQLRTKKRTMNLTDNFEIVDEQVNVLEKMELVMQEKIFYHHFNQLSAKCKEILGQFFNKTSMKQIAEQHNTSESYVKKRKHICKQSLVQAIQADPEYKDLMQYE